MQNLTTQEREVMDLLGAIWDDNIDDASRNRLEDLLSRPDSDGVRILVDFTEMHLDLELIVSSMSAQRRAMDAITRAGRTTPRRARWPSRAGLVASLAAACVVAFCTLWYTNPWKDGWGHSSARGHLAGAPIVRPRVPVGRLASSQGTEWRDGGALVDGQTLSIGQVIEPVSGNVRISMDVGAEIVLQSPCRATLIAGDLVLVEHGTVAVKVAKWAKGFRIKTTDMLVTDMGTRFLVHANTRTGSEVHVLEGLVVADSLRQPASTLRIAAIQAAAINPKGDLVPVPFKRVSLADALEPLRPLRPIALANTGIGAHEGEPDQKWIIRSGDARHGPYPQSAMVVEAASIYGSNEQDRSQWISVKEGTTRGVPVRTKYTFETMVDLTGYDVNTVRLVGLVLADNGIEEVLLNGRQLPITPWYDWYAGVTFFGFHTIEVSNGFVAGKNVISFVVVNETILSAEEETDAPPETPNPMALRVEWRASGRPR